jgi:hypothetical protein
VPDHGTWQGPSLAQPRSAGAPRGARDERPRKLAARWLERLLENRDTRVDAAATLLAATRALAGVARLQGRDWCYEGALQRLAQQQNGSFRADRGDTLLLESTCFAVLLPRQATLAVITGR